MLFEGVRHCLASHRRLSVIFSNVGPKGPEAITEGVDSVARWRVLGGRGALRPSGIVTPRRDK
jgi:hypothetical protein